MIIGGIYKIVNEVSGKVYVGSAVDMNHRWNEHKRTLRENKHHSIHLQRAWNIYGKDNFRFEIIEECEKEKLIEREQHWMNFYKSYNENKGYNISPTAGSKLGIKSSEETKKKISKNHADFSGENSHVAKLTWEQVREIRRRYKEEKIFQSQLALEYGVKQMQISRIILNKVWKEDSYKIFRKKLYVSEETKKKLREINIGKRHTEETKKKMSKTRIGLIIGEKHPMFGKHHFKETKQKISNAVKGDKHPLAKISLDIANEIRRKYKEEKISQKQLGIEYGIVQTVVSKIINFQL